VVGMGQKYLTFSELGVSPKCLLPGKRVVYKITHSRGHIMGILLCRTSSTTLPDSLGCEMGDGRVRLNNGGRQISRKGKRKRGMGRKGREGCCPT